MMPQGLRPAGNWFETIVSALVILVAAAFIVFVYAQTGTRHFGSYSLTLRMPSAAGLDVGKDVRVGGVKVGSISRLSLDRRDYSAVVDVDVRDDLLLPTDRQLASPRHPWVMSIWSSILAALHPQVPPGGTLAQPGARRVAPAGGT